MTFLSLNDSVKAFVLDELAGINMRFLFLTLPETLDLNVFGSFRRRQPSKHDKRFDLRLQQLTITTAEWDAAISATH